MNYVKPNDNMTNDFAWTTSTDTITLDIGSNMAAAATDYYISDSTSVGTITIPSGVSGQVLTTNNTGYTYNNWVSPNITFGGNDSSSIQVGEDFSIVAPKDGPASFKYKDQEMEIGQLFSMFNAFKTLLKSVANDKEFCDRHPEIRDMAYGYLVEELKK